MPFFRKKSNAHNKAAIKDVIARIEAIRKRKAEVQPGSLRYFLEDDAWPAGSEGGNQEAPRGGEASMGPALDEPPLEEVDHLLAAELEKYVQRYEARDDGLREGAPDASVDGWRFDAEAEPDERDVSAA